VVGQFARDELRHSERATATRLGQLAAAHYQSRWQACCDDAPHLGERLDDPRWLTLTLQYLNGLLWHNTGSTRTFLAARFVEAMLFDWGFVHALLNLAEAFTRPADWWPRQSQILFRTLHQLLQAEGLDELEPLDELLNRADELDLDPTHQACIHHRRGQVLYEADQALKALDACQRADALLSDDPTLYASVAQLYTRIGWELCLVRNAVVPSVEAEQAFQRAIALRPGAGQAYVGHGVALHGLKRHTKAIQVLQKGIELQGERAYSLNGLGAIYYAQKRYDQAVAAYRRAIELDPNDAAPYNNLGAVYRSQKRYDQAIAAYRRAIELDPNDADLYCNRGVAYSVMGDLAQAEADYLRALELAPDEGWVYASLAGVYRRRDDEEQHAVYLAQARRRLPPDDDYAQACLASIAGDADAAISYLARALEQDLEQRDGAREDPDLHWIRDDPRYQALVAGDE